MGSVYVGRNYAKRVLHNIIYSITLSSWKGFMQKSKSIYLDHFFVIDLSISLILAVWIFKEVRDRFIFVSALTGSPELYVSCY